MTSEESKNIDVNEVVEEITVALSQHLNRVIKSITNEQNNNINENIKILQTLPLVQNLQKENKELTEKLNALQEKYKNTLEELISLKNETTIYKNVTMEISELEQNVIKTNIKDILTPLQIPSLNDWNINMSDDDDEYYADTFNKLSEEDKNKDATEDEKDSAIQNYKNFYKNHELMGLNALSYSDLLKQVMESSAGIKGWSGAVPEELSAENAREEEDDEEEEEEEKEEKKLINDAIAEYEEGEEDDEEEDDEEEDDEEEAEEEEDAEDGGDEIELEELLIKDKLYYTDNKQNGDIYECLSDGEIGDIIGNLENGAVFFS